jgi:hypothetical protein
MTVKFARITLTSLFTLLLLTVGAAQPRVSRAQPTVSAYCVSNVDASAWPNVSLRLRPVDSSGRFIEGLSSAPLFENGQAAEDVKLAQQEGPLHFALLVDGGRTPSRATRQAMQRAVARLSESGVFRNGMDSVLVRVLANAAVTRPTADSDVRVNWTTDAGVINTLTKSDFLPTNARQTKGLDAIERLMRDVKDRVGQPAGTPAVMVFLSNRIEASNGNAETDAVRWAELLRADQIPAYVIQTAAADSAPLKALAGGPTFYAVASTKTDAAVDALYQSMSNQRRFYSVTLTSKYTAADARTITAFSPDGRGVCQDGDSYTFVADQPQFVFDNVPSRLLFDTNNDRVKIKVQVNWPKDTPRELSSANLLIDGERRAEGQILDRSRLLEFTIFARDMQDKTAAELKVEVTDASDKRFTSQVKLVDVTNQIEIAPQPTLPAPTATPPVDTRGSLPVSAVAGIAAAALAAGGAGAFFLLRRSRRGGASGLQEQVMATITVLEGPHGRRNEKIKLAKPRYVIGRQDADIVFFSDMPKSTVSRTHCTITRDNDMGFWLTDNVSSNGTKLNGKPVPPNQRVPLNSGDQILLGEIDRNGVLLQFSLDHPTQFVKAQR